jgi:hypothetical protein
MRPKQNETEQNTMTNHEPSQKHWLEPVLSRELAAVEAPARLGHLIKEAKPAPRDGRTLVSRKLAWAGGTLAACAMGVMMHSYAGQALTGQTSMIERGAAASAINSLRPGVKAAQFSGACHLCHSDL